MYNIRTKGGYTLYAKINYFHLFVSLTGQPGYDYLELGNYDLPVRAGHVHIAKATLRVSTDSRGLGHAVEPELDAARLQAVEPAKRFAVPSHPARYSTIRATFARMS